MIELNESLYFSKGTTRKCFFHPEHDDLCIKIPLENEGKRTRGILRAISRENKFYLKLKKQKASWEHLSEYKGDVDTNFGRGSVYQLIRNDDGEISTNLERYLQSNSPIENSDELSNELDKLYNYMQKNRILTTSLLPRNVVIQKLDGRVKLVIIDDIGNSEFIPVSQYMTSFAQRKIKRKWNGFKKRIQILQSEK